MKRFTALQLGALTAAVMCLAPQATKADEYDKKTIVTFDQPTEVPGIVLPPGKYVIKLLNSSSNRHIAEVMNERMDHLYALTFTTAAERLSPIRESENKKILTFYEGKNGQPQAIRQWFWPGDTIGQEFLYPKNQAAKIAANTGEKVAEGNLPTQAESGEKLTPDNANGLTLQSSDESRTNNDSQTNNESKPAARPFTAQAAEPAAPTVIAQNTPPPAPQTQPAPPADNSSSTSTSTSAAVSPSSTDKTLPQTASNVPLIGVIGLISLALALFMAFVKRSGSLS